MAYVLWRVFMKRYSKVRLGLRNLPVIPAERRGPEKEETWTLAPDQSGDACPFFDDVSDIKPKPIQDADNPQSRILDPGESQQSSQQLAQEHPETGTLPRSQETRKSKTKKVKSYLRKCKGALSKGDEVSTEKKRQEHCTSWYLDESHQEDVDTFHLQKQNSEFLDERIAEEASSALTTPLEDGSREPLESSPDPATDFSKEVEAGDEANDETLARLGEDEGLASDLRRSRSSLYEDARDSMNDRECIAEESCKNDAISLETLTTEEITNLNKCDSNDTLIAEVAANGPPLVEEGKEEESEEVDGETLRALSLFGGRGDVASLVRNLLGPIYGDGVINLLIRQARDILVCAYHGNLENFLKTYLSPAATLLAEVKSAAACEMGNDSAEYCIDEVNKFCSTTKKHEIGIESNCNATYGNIHELLVPLQSYAYGNIEYSFRFLLMSTYLGNYENQREGFKKLYRKYSDEMWENGIDLIKYITKRGGSMNFGQEPKFTPMIKTLELNEFASLATALEIQKSFANQALKIHEKANKKQDSAIAHYIEEKFLEPQADRVRELAGHIRDMKRFIDESSSHLSIFLFDQYLQQSV